MERTRVITFYSYPFGIYVSLHAYAGAGDTQANHMCSAHVHQVTFELYYSLNKIFVQMADLIQYTKTST